ncbi:MAG TPA: hypothetical protein ENJ09_04945 [Planctomycetes bacterium]|nr:hypothetical protein [Planctomycetota bacterium]
MRVQGFRTLDCAHKVRIRYFLPVPLDRALLARLGGDSLDVQEFSKSIPGASDHAAFSKSGVWHATCALDGRELVVTFGRSGPEPAASGDPSPCEEAIAAFERNLRAALERRAA